MRLKLSRVARSVHNWAGLILAIQILLWILGGVVMSVIPLEKVHGKHLASKSLPSSLTRADYSFSLDQLIATIPQAIRSLNYHHINNQAYYLITTEDQILTFNAQTGEPYKLTNKDEVANIAKQHYLGSGSIKQIVELEQAPLEASANKGKVWQVKFDDTWTTTLYISPASAQVKTIRSDIWRIFDFFWMLHIMDYDTRDDFNNPILITFASAALVFTFSGIYLLFPVFGRKLRKARQQSQQTEA